MKLGYVSVAASMTMVTVDFGSGVTSLLDLFGATTCSSQKLLLDLYPGEVRTFRKP